MGHTADALIGDVSAVHLSVVPLGSVIGNPTTNDTIDNLAKAVTRDSLAPDEIASPTANYGFESMSEFRVTVPK